MTVPVASDNPAIARLAREVEALVASGVDEAALTAAVAERLRVVLHAGIELPAEKTRPRADRYVMHPLHVAGDGSFSIAAAVWDVGQSTPVHGHETWGVVGIYSGFERETRYSKPTTPDQPLGVTAAATWGPGDVTVCCTVDDDIHAVSCGSGIACVGIHIYGADIGTLRRRTYDPRTGEVGWFVSAWPG